MKKGVVSDKEEQLTKRRSGAVAGGFQGEVESLCWPVHRGWSLGGSQGWLQGVTPRPDKPEPTRTGNFS